ncbi:hypothetical protein COY28_02150 [Candidatus Woesearchaeota archaeon CG_4_10_14_0_2_um_filter_57_5]|nr:MAG: hypothetical protein COY28_02150 [Candidatus Woesearchaeota archaeon CG_4_10_14_0_2_um_filter_57_5]
MPDFGGASPDLYEVLGQTQDPVDNAADLMLLSRRDGSLYVFKPTWLGDDIGPDGRPYTLGPQGVLFNKPWVGDTVVEPLPGELEAALASNGDGGPWHTLDVIAKAAQTMVGREYNDLTAGTGQYAR